MREMVSARRQPPVHLAQLVGELGVLLLEGGGSATDRPGAKGGVAHQERRHRRQDDAEDRRPEHAIETSTTFEGSDPCGTRTTVQRRLAIPSPPHAVQIELRHLDL
jgi:hypothetical protein